MVARNLRRIRNQPAEMQPPLSVCGESPSDSSFLRTNAGYPEFEAGAHNILKGCAIAERWISREFSPLMDKKFPEIEHSGKTRERLGYTGRDPGAMAQDPET